MFQAGRRNAYHHGVCYAGRDVEGVCVCVCVRKKEVRLKLNEERIRHILVPQA